MLEINVITINVNRLNSLFIRLHFKNSAILMRDIPTHLKKQLKGEKNDLLRKYQKQKNFRSESTDIVARYGKVKRKSHDSKVAFPKVQPLRNLILKELFEKKDLVKK